MKYLLLLVLCSTVNCNNCPTRLLPSSVEEYYWRDFNGLVPTDALPGGKNADGETTYIGQMYIPAEYNTETSKIHVIPVIITNGNRIAVGAYGKTTRTSNDDSYVKVLCTSNKQNFHWHSRDLPVKVGCRFVIAGFEDSIPMLFGRTEHKNETIVGKVFSGGNEHNTGLIFPYENGQVISQTYKILMYC